ncbi:MAG: hypothetical protein LAT58_08765 [Opitutales bacterium]|nr:hypothetical protein [Opitutales bacterium]
MIIDLDFRKQQSTGIRHFLAGFAGYADDHGVIEDDVVPIANLVEFLLVDDTKLVP